MYSLCSMRVSKACRLGGIVSRIECIPRIGHCTRAHIPVSTHKGLLCVQVIACCPGQ